MGVRINDFAQRNAQRKADLICDLAHCYHLICKTTLVLFTVKCDIKADFRYCQAGSWQFQS